MTARATLFATLLLLPTLLLATAQAYPPPPALLCDEAPPADVDFASNGYGDDYVIVEACTEPTGESSRRVRLPNAVWIELRGDDVHTCRYSLLSTQEHDCRKAVGLTDAICDAVPIVRQGNDGYGNGYFHVWYCTSATGARDGYYWDPTYDILNEW